MRGSLLMKFETIPGSTEDYYEVFVNGVLRDLHYNRASDLYSTFVNTGDVVTINSLGPYAPANIDVSRRDYTTNDEGGDMGIKLTPIASSILSTITFTVSKRDDDYAFNYLIDVTGPETFYLLTQAYQPILTESGENITQQY